MLQGDRQDVVDIVRHDTTQNFSKAGYKFFDSIELFLLQHFVIYHYFKLLLLFFPQARSYRTEAVCFWPCESSGFSSHLRLAEKSVLD